MPGYRPRLCIVPVTMVTSLYPATLRVVTAAANTGNPTLPVNDLNPTGTTGNILWQLLQLLFLFGLIMVLAIVVTRFLGRRLNNLSNGKAIRVLDCTCLGSNRAIYAVEIGEQVLILGVTEQQINLLTEVDNPRERNDLRQRAAAETLPLSNRLQRWLPGWSGGNKPGLSDNGGLTDNFAGQLERQLSRLHRLSQTEQSPAEPGRKPEGE